ncbi:MAG: amino acid-binding protein [Lachnospiraceae bacterium]
MLKQLAIFVENRPGSLREITSSLHEQAINIYAFSSFDTPEFGILRMVVDKPDEAKAKLTQQGFVTRVSEVIAVELEDEQGGMDHLLGALQESNISINYAYSSFGRMSHIPAIIVHTNEIDETEEVLISKGFQCVHSLS